MGALTPLAERADATPTPAEMRAAPAMAISAPDTLHLPFFSQEPENHDVVKFAPPLGALADRSLVFEAAPEKDRLDFARVYLGLTRGWLFVHVPVTYALVVLSVLHVIVVYAYFPRISSKNIPVIRSTRRSSNG